MSALTNFVGGSKSIWLRSERGKSATTNSKPYIPPPPEADGHYRYFLIATINPVRIKYSAHNSPIGADALDRDRPGTLTVRTTLISTVEKDELDVEEISKEQFVEFCRRDALRPKGAVPKPYVRW